MEDQLGPGLGEEPLRRVRIGEVVLGAPGDDRLEPALAQALDEVRPEEPGAPGDERPHGARRIDGSAAAQSTRPIQRSRLAAYQAIVRATPSSQETRGAQPVSAWSLS